FVRAFCGMAAQPSAGSVPAAGEHPVLMTPGATPPGAMPIMTPPLGDTGSRGSVTGAGGQLVVPGGGRRRVVLGVAGGLLGLLGGGAVLALSLRAHPTTTVLEPPADLRPAAR